MIVKNRKQLIIIPYQEWRGAEGAVEYTGNTHYLSSLLWKYLQGTGVTVAECRRWAELHISHPRLALKDIISLPIYADVRIL